MDLFFDLDGTLTDPFEGITKSIEYALESLEIPNPGADALGWAIGPALIDSFEALGAKDPQAALDLYRERYRAIGKFENEPYPGMLEMLEGLKRDGHRLFLMTAKPHAYATEITAHYGIAPFMTAQYGPELDGTRNNKAELLAYALNIIGSDVTRSLMIGDRIHDFEAARANGMDSIAVCWGFGTQSELANATHRCQEMSDLRPLINSL